jgi:two-component system, chemotaxis family, chemotaxis protein CheY
MKVLLVDDSSIIRMMLKNILSQMGVSEFTEAGNGIEGFAAMGNAAYDVVFLDMHMPEMDGLEFLERKNRNPALADIPVIVVSSDAEKNQMDKAMALGARTYVTKPFRFEALKDALQRATVRGAV